MNQITTEEKKTLNQISQQRDPDVSLGDILETFIGEVGIKDGTPVNAVSAKETLTLTGVVVDGETISIGGDVYEFAADAEQSVTLGNIAVDIEVNTTKATDTLTIPTQPTAGNTMWIGTKIFTFVPDGTANAEGEVSIGTDLATAQANILAAINGTDGINNPSDAVVASAFVANVSTITALVGGVLGNTIPTTETFTAVDNVFSAIALAAGADCTAANAIIALVAAITASDTQGVGAVDGDGDTVVLTSDLGGVAANEITLATTMANATFGAGATELSGGVDATVAVGRTSMIDDTYLYIAQDGNTVSEKNWRRIALGVAY